MKRIQNKAIAGIDDLKNLAEDGKPLVRRQAFPAQGSATQKGLNDALAVNAQEAADMPKIDRYHAACYIRDMLTALQNIARTSGLGQVEPGLDTALETAICHAETAVNMQQ